MVGYGRLQANQMESGNWPLGQTGLLDKEISHNEPFKISDELHLGNHDIVATELFVTAK